MTWVHQGIGRDNGTVWPVCVYVCVCVCARACERERERREGERQSVCVLFVCLFTCLPQKLGNRHHKTEGACPILGRSPAVFRGARATSLFFFFFFFFFFVSRREGSLAIRAGGRFLPGHASLAGTALSLCRLVCRRHRKIVDWGEDSVLDKRVSGGRRVVGQKGRGNCGG